ncbi:hypothetical protein EK904_001886 [Melospiza melodia maxima]|nr:hypothetical protein EK904_001886 [Melospiza melodia maxima]
MDTGGSQAQERGGSAHGCQTPLSRHRALKFGSLGTNPLSPETRLCCKSSHCKNVHSMAGGKVAQARKYCPFLSEEHLAMVSQITVDYHNSLYLELDVNITHFQPSENALSPSRDHHISTRPTFHWHSSSFLISFGHRFTKTLQQMLTFHHIPKEINADQEREDIWIFQTRQISPNEKAVPTQVGP